MFVLGAFSAGVSAQFRDNFSSVVGIVQISQLNRQGSNSQLPPKIAEQLINSSIGSDIQRYNVEVELTSDLTLPYAGSMKNVGDRIVVIGLNLTLDMNFQGASTKITNGSNLQANKGQAIMDSRLAKNFSTSVGDLFALRIKSLPQIETYNLTIVGFYNERDSGAPSFVPRTYYVYTDLETAWAISALMGNENRTYSKISLRFPAVNNDEAQKYVDQINNLSDSGYFEDTLVNAFSLAQFQGQIESSLGIIDTFTLVISLITSIAGGMAIIVSQLMSVMERMKEFAILKSTGWKNSHIFKNVIYESMTLGILGAIIGIGIGLSLIIVFSSNSGPFGSIRAVITFDLVLRVLIFALGIGIIGGLYPAYKASHVRPVQVLKGE